MTERFVKLVRSKVVGEDDEVVYRQFGLSNEEFHWALKRKLVEEALEYIESGNLDELVDVYEVIRELSAFHAASDLYFLDLAKEMRCRKGGFLERMSMWIRRPDHE